MKISLINIGDDQVEITTERDGKPLILIYKGEVNHQFRVERDGFMTVGISVSPNTRTADPRARRANRPFNER